MLKAASLIYAIFISLVIGILCYTLVLLFSLNLNLEDHFDTKKNLIANNRSALQYLLANYGKIILDEEIKLFPDNDGILTSFQESNWGLFQKFVVSSISKNDSIVRTVLLASKHNSSSPAIYLRDSDTELKIAGKTNINGNIYISKYGLKKTTVSGNSGLYEPQFNGLVFTSEKMLPQVANYTNIYPEDFDLLLISEIRENFIFNPFDKKTKVIEVGNILEDINLKGNIIVRSKDTLYIMPSAHIEDIIIEAPKVVFTDGVEAIAQVFSKHEIVLEQNVTLNYPTILVVNGTEEIHQEKKILIGENTVVKGAILLYGNGIAEEIKNTLIIEKKSVVTGDIYCDGLCSIYGTVKGSIYTSSFLHKTESTEYRNLIFDGNILNNELPKDFFQISLMENFKNEDAIVLKSL